MRSNQSARKTLPPLGAGAQPFLPTLIEECNFPAPDNMPIKADIEALSYPYFSLSHLDDSVRQYQYTSKKGVETVTIRPGEAGTASSREKEFWIFIVSKAHYGLTYMGIEMPSRVRFTVAEFLKFTGRSRCGRSYQSAVTMLERIRGVVIEHRMKHKESGLSVVGPEERLIVSGHIKKEGLDSEKEKAPLTGGGGFQCSEKNVGDSAVRDCKTDYTNRDVVCEVVLPKKIVDLIKERKILTLSDGYFDIHGAMARRVYEIGRKFCGNQASQALHLPHFLARLGSTDRNVSRLMARIRTLFEDDILPDYHVSLEYHPHRGGPEPYYVVFRRKSDAQLHDDPIDLTPETIAGPSADEVVASNRRKKQDLSDNVGPQKNKKKASIYDHPLGPKVKPEADEPTYYGFTQRELTARNAESLPGEDLFEFAKRLYQTIKSGMANVTPEALDPVVGDQVSNPRSSNANDHHDAAQLSSIFGFFKLRVELDFQGGVSPSESAENRWAEYGLESVELIVRYRHRILGMITKKSLIEYADMVIDHLEKMADR